MRLLVFIPAYNEEKSILGAVRDLQENCPGIDYVVINDGSTDGTKRVCEENRIPCISLPVNLGLDGVFQTGNRWAFEHGYDAAVAFDGDGQHRAEYIPRLLATLEEGYDIVVGSRFLQEKKKGSLRAFGSKILSALFHAATGRSFTDPTSGMRMVRRSVMERIAYDVNCGPEPDTWQYLVNSGFRFTEVPVRMNARTQGESCFNFRSSAFFMLRMIVSMTIVGPFRKKQTLT